MAEVHGGRGEAREVEPASSPYVGASPYTFEGEVDGLARFAKGVRAAPPGVKRNFAIFMTVVLAFPFGIALVSMLIELISGSAS
jgi:hypothetical protein